MYIVFQVCPTSLLIVAWTQFVQASKWVLKNPASSHDTGEKGICMLAHWTSPIALCDLQQVVLFWFFRNIFLVKLQARVIHFRVQMFQQIWMRHLSVWIPSCLWLLWITKLEASKGWMLKNDILYCTRTLFQQKSFSVFRCLKKQKFSCSV